MNEDQAGDLNTTKEEVEKIAKDFIEQNSNEESVGKTLDESLDTDRAIDKSHELQNALAKARSFDVVVKIIIRIILTGFFPCLLWVQNTKVFDLVSKSLNTGTMDNLQLIFSILITTTLGETYWIAKIIVKWACKEIDYKS